MIGQPAFDTESRRPFSKTSRWLTPQEVHVGQVNGLSVQEFGGTRSGDPHA